MKKLQPVWKENLMAIIAKLIGYDLFPEETKHIVIEHQSSPIIKLRAQMNFDARMFQDSYLQGDDINLNIKDSLSRQMVKEISKNMDTYGVLKSERQTSINPTDMDRLVYTFDLRIVLPNI